MILYTRDVPSDALKAQRSILSTRSRRVLSEYPLRAYSPTLRYLDFVSFELGSEPVSVITRRGSEIDFWGN
jgi:hypothetical protein